MKTILLLTTEFPPYHGGIGTYTWQIARAAHALGHAVTVLAPDYGRNVAVSDRDDYPFTVHRFRGGTYGGRDLLPMLIRLWRMVRVDRWNIIHAVDWPDVLGMSLVRRIVPVSFVATAYGTEILGVLGSRHIRLLASGQLFAAPVRILAISEYTRSLLLERCPDVSADKVTVTPLGVAERFFESQDKEATRRIKQKYGIPQEREALLTLARLDERKGHRVVLQALATLSAQLKQRIVYVIAGKGDDERYLADLKKLAAGCGVPVIFTGPVADEDLVALYGGVTLFCMPGEPHLEKVEGFGLVYLEAAAQGVPAIATRVGAVPEVVRHDETGLLVAPGDVAALTAALASLLENPTRLRKLGTAARENAHNHTWERCAQLSYDL